MKFSKCWLRAAALAASLTPTLRASEADIRIPDLHAVSFLNGSLSGINVLMIGLVVCVLAMIYGWWQYVQTKNLPVHASMAAVSQIIWETCKTYLFQQGKFLAMLWVLIAACMTYYFAVLSERPAGQVALVLAASVLGILGSYGVAWFGIRINTVANSRAAFSALRGNPLATLAIPLKSGMSVGLLLVAIELFFMICILRFLPSELAGPCFIGFAIGESLGASALRICGGIFTKIADIGADLMKIVFSLPEDDPRNPGVIADCTGDNAGDSVGPTADGFETYGVTGVALIAFLALALAANPALCGTLIVWLFAMRILMVITSLVSYLVNEGISKALFGSKPDFNLEQPLTNLVWISSLVSIGVTYAATYILLARHPACGPDLWWVLSTIISLGTIAGALIPEFTKVFTSTEIAPREGSSDIVPPGRRIAQYIVRPRRRKLLGVLDRARDPRADVRCVSTLGACGLAGHDAGRIPVRGAHLRFRPRGIRLPRNGAGDDRGRQLRTGDGQRPIRI